MPVHRQTSRARLLLGTPLRVLAVVALATIGLVAAIGSGSTTTSNKPVGNVSTAGGSAHGSSGSSTKTPADVAHVGSTIAVDDGAGQKGEVTLVQVIDPAQGASPYDSPDQGKRFVGVKFTIRNTGSKAFEDDVNTTASLKGSDNQAYSPTFDGISGCTNFNNGTYTLAPGESVTGCATFEVPEAVKVTQVNYEPTSAIGRTAGQWLVP